MYKAGDHVFYPKGGVFVIEKKCDKTIGAHSLSFFDLISNDGKIRISIPTGNVERVGVRHLVSPAELDQHMADWSPDLKVSKLHHKNRKSRFEMLRQTGEFRNMSTVVVTIHYLINKTKATFEEKRMYDQIRKRMINEIEIVRGWTDTQAEAMLQKALDSAILRPPKEEPATEEDPNSEEGVAIEDHKVLA